jgi:hypothetical protein
MENKASCKEHQPFFNFCILRRPSKQVTCSFFSQLNHVLTASSITLKEFSGMYLRVVSLEYTDVSEVSTASMIRAMNEKNFRISEGRAK